MRWRWWLWDGKPQTAVLLATLARRAAGGGVLTVSTPLTSTAPTLLWRQTRKELDVRPLLVTFRADMAALSHER